MQARDIMQAMIIAVYRRTYYCRHYAPFNITELLPHPLAHILHRYWEAIHHQTDLLLSIICLTAAETDSHADGH